MALYLRLVIRLVFVLVTPAVAHAQATETVVYFHVDAVGSVRMVTDANGQVLERHDYAPFGEPVQASSQTSRFAGSERDSESELGYFGARHYRPNTGRFTTIDPVLDSGKALAEPQRWNRYAYSLNNSLAFVDPDGRDPKAVLMRLVQSQPVQRLINHPRTQNLLSASGMSQGTVALQRLNNRLFDLSVRLFSSAPAPASSSVWQTLERTGANYQNTNLPTQFTLRIGSKLVEVVPNATKHIYERLYHLSKLGGSPQAIDLSTQFRLASLQDAVTRAIEAGVRNRELILIGDWELAFLIDKGKTVLIHAVQK